MLTLLASPLVTGSVGFGLAVGLLLLLFILYVYGGLYYSLPRLAMRWLSRRALLA